MISTLQLGQLGRSGVSAVSQSMTFTSSYDGITSDITQSGRIWTVRSAAGDLWHKARCSTTRGSVNGSFYFEVWVLNNGSSSAMAIGIATAGTSTMSSVGGVENAGNGSRRQYFNDARKRESGVYESYGASYTAGDVIGIGLVKSGTSITLTAYKNGVSQGTMYTFTSSATFDPHFCSFQNNGALRSPAEIVYLPPGFIPWV